MNDLNEFFAYYEDKEYRFVLSASSGKAQVQNVILKDKNFVDFLAFLKRDDNAILETIKRIQLHLSMSVQEGYENPQDHSMVTYLYGLKLSGKFQEHLEFVETLKENRALWWTRIFAVKFLYETEFMSLKEACVCQDAIVRNMDIRHEEMKQRQALEDAWMFEEEEVLDEH